MSTIGGEKWTRRGHRYYKVLNGHTIILEQYRMGDNRQWDWLVESNKVDIGGENAYRYRDEAARDAIAFAESL